MKTVRALFLGFVALVTIFAGAPATSAAVPLAAAALPLSSVAYNGYGYAAFVSAAPAGSSITVGAISYSGISCTTAAGIKRSNSAATVDLGVGKLGSVTSSAETIGSTTAKTTKSTASAQSVNLFGGLITASGVTTTSTSTITSAGVSSGTSASSLANLQIGGVAVNASTPANTIVALKLGGTTIGRVVVNQQVRTSNGSGTAVITSALDVTLTTAALGLPAGARVIVARSAASLTGVPAGMAGGEGYGVKATTLSGAVKSGPVANAYPPCTGGSAASSAASATVPAVASLGAIATTTDSTVTPTLTVGVKNTIASLNVLNGVISASAINAQTSATRSSSTAAAVLTDKSTFGSLKVLGLPLITPTVAPNTKVTIAGLGTVTLHKVVKTTTSIRVVMVEIVLGQALGTLPTGTVIEIGVSNSLVK